ncbi:prolyl endopeptidase-like isoform X2 [Dendronephthya gigantea]|nr:prolyl endopeptidase-like isoform X2 [Dendronephthya gigantea]XP_028410329.1 prolyl endopeptidase-like isoform X2 [Dendronephthya gigantea]XP_028410330.1 prolyl endopeptidase-like isoform X2 [Dendronephthya gigantea]
MRDTVPFQRQLVRKFENLTYRSGNCLEKNAFVSYGNYLYYTKRSRNSNLLVHCRRLRNGADEEILLDESTIVSLWNFFEVRTMKISPSQRFVAFILDTSGIDTYCGIVIDTVKKPGRILEQLPCVNLEWAGVDGVLYYTTFNELHRADKTWRHKIGEIPSKDELIFEENDARFFVDVSCTKDRRFVTINSSSKTTSEVYILDSADTRASAQLVRAREPGIEYYIEHCRVLFYILTNYPDGGNYRVLSKTEKDLCETEWNSSVQNYDNVVLDDMDIFSKYLVLYEKEDLTPRVRVLPLLGKNKQYTIKFDNDITLLTPGYNVNFHSSVVQFTISSAITPPRMMELDLQSGRMRNLSATSLENVGKVPDVPLCRSKLLAVSKDGKKVPVTIFHRKDNDLNGQHPALVHVYGSYGMNVNMEFSPEKLHLLKEGWILAYCHVRGGGELGRKWYHTGREKNKKKTFQDFEACVKAIHEHGYSSPHLTAAIGTSAGGLPVAVLCNDTPHLVKAAVLKVPFVDLITAMLDEGLPLTAQEYEEFGNPRIDVQDFNNLKSFCPYVSISKQKYPSMLFMPSMNDVRVPYWMSLKYVSKLRHLNSITKYYGPQNMILLKTDLESGHFGSGASEESAFILAFLYKALGLPLR